MSFEHVLTSIAEHLPLLSSLVAIAVAIGSVRAQRSAKRAADTATTKTTQDIADRPAHAWRDTAEALEKRLDLLEPLAQRVPTLEAKVARLEKDNLTLRLNGGKERRTIERLKARIAQLVKVIQDMGGTVPPEQADLPTQP